MGRVLTVITVVAVALMAIGDVEAGKGKKSKGKNPRAKFKDVGGTADLFGPYFQRKNYHKGSHGIVMDRNGRFYYPKSSSKPSKDIDLRKFDPGSLKPRYPDKLHVNPGPGGAGDIDLRKFDPGSLKPRNPSRGSTGSSMPKPKPKPRAAINGGKMTRSDWNAPNWLDRFINSNP